jgi:hypothetical protein
LGAALCGLLGAALSGNALAASSVSATAATPGTQATPSTAASSSSAHKTASKTSSAPKSSTHSSSAHKTSRKAGSSHIGTQQASNGHGKKGSKSSKKRGQQAIDHERATAIQEALIREHYLHGEPSGTWDGTTQAAMQKYQADQGWQSKTTPDSRALIKLGLGPSKDHLLNPESAMTSSPATGDPKNAARKDTTENHLPHQ